MLKIKPTISSDEVSRAPKATRKTRVAAGFLAGASVAFIAAFGALFMSDSPKEDAVDIPEIPTIIKQRLDMATPFAQLSDTGYRMRARTLIADSSYAKPTDTIEDMFSGTDEEVMSRLMFQTESVASIYDYGDSDTYVAFLDGAATNGWTGDLQDIVFARDNTKGETLDGDVAWFDYGRKLAFVDKDYFADCEKESLQEGQHEIQAQMLALYDTESETEISIPVRIASESDSLTKMARVCALDNSISIQVVDEQDADKITMDDITVSVNDGSLVLNGESIHEMGSHIPSLDYGSDNGAICINNVAPMQATNVSISVQAEISVSAKEDSNVVKTALAGTITKPTNAAYTNGTIGKANLRGYAEGDAGWVPWDGSTNTTTFLCPPGTERWKWSTMTTRYLNYDKWTPYVAKLGACPSTLGESWDVDPNRAWAANCFHCSYPDGNLPDNGGWYKVLSADSNKQTIIIAFACLANRHTSDGGTQDGSTVLKFNAPRNGVAVINKYANPNPDLSAWEQTVYDSEFGLYKTREDAAARRNALAISEADIEGRATITYGKSGTYYVRELSCPWPYLVSDEIIQVQLTYGQKTSYTMYDDTVTPIKIRKEIRPAAGQDSKITVTSGGRKIAEVKTTIGAGSKTASTAIKALENLPQIAVSVPYTTALQAPTCADSRYNAETKTISSLNAGETITLSQNFVAGRGWKATTATAPIISLKINGGSYSMSMPMNSASIDGSTYEIYSDANCTRFVASVRLNDNGEGVYGANDNEYVYPNTTYYVREVAAVSGYAVSPEVFPVTTGRNSAAIARVIDSYNVLRLHKRSKWSDYTSKLHQFTLAGARYGVFSERGYAASKMESEVVITYDLKKAILVTDANGESQQITLGDGTYYVTELPSSITRNGVASMNTLEYPLANLPLRSAAVNNIIGQYLIDDTVYAVTLRNGSVVDVTSEENIPVKIKIDKQTTRDDLLYLDQFSLEGAVFGVYTSQSAAQSAPVVAYGDWTRELSTEGAVAVLYGRSDGTTSATGELPLKDYWVKEIRSPRNYYYSNDDCYWSIAGKTVTDEVLHIAPSDFIESGNYIDGILATPSSLSRINKPKEVSVQLQKTATEVPDELLVDSCVMNLSGAKFAVYNTQADAKADVNRCTFVTDDGDHDIITTKADGSSNKAIGLYPQEHYWLREIEPPHVHSDDAVQEQKNIEASYYLLDSEPIMASFENGLELLLTAHKNNIVKPVEIELYKFPFAIDASGKNLHVDSNPAYAGEALSGALFAVYDNRDAADTSPITDECDDFGVEQLAYDHGAIAVLQSDNTGNCGKVSNLIWKANGYYVREIKAPTSGAYKINENVLQIQCYFTGETGTNREFEVKSETIYSKLGFDEVPYYYYVKIEKKSDTTSVLNANGSTKTGYELEGIHFGIYKTYDEAKAATEDSQGTPLYNLYTQAVTGSDGKIRYEAITGLTGPGTFWAKELVNNKNKPLGFQVLSEPIRVEAKRGTVPDYNKTPIVPENAKASFPPKSKTAAQIDGVASLSVLDDETEAVEGATVYQQQLIIGNPVGSPENAFADMIANMHAQPHNDVAVLEEAFAKPDDGVMDEAGSEEDGSIEDILANPQMLEEAQREYDEWTRTGATKEYTIRFDSGAMDCVGTMEDIVTNFHLGEYDTSQDDFQLPANAFHRSGYTFAGWRTNVNDECISDVIIADEQSFHNMHWKDERALEAQKDKISEEMDLRSFVPMSEADSCVITLTALWTPNDMPDIIENNPYEEFTMSVMTSSTSYKNLYRAVYSGAYFTYMYTDGQSAPSGFTANIKNLGKVPDSSSTPVYCAQNPNVTNSYLFTTSAWEYNSLVNTSHWNGKGVRFYSDDAGGTGLTRDYHSASGAHWYDTSSRSSESGWRYEGTPLYVLKFYNIAYNGNGGSGSVATQTNRQYGISYTLSGNGFTRTGYTFLGWSTNSAATSASYSAGATVSNMTTTAGGTVTLYAIWSVNSYKVTYAATDPNSGLSPAMTGTAPTQPNVKYGSSFTVAANTFHKYGYKFTGWKYTDAGGTARTVQPGASLSNLRSANGAEVVFTAQWATSTYTVQFNSGLSSQWGVAASTTSSSYAEGYKQTMWYDDYATDGVTGQNLLASQYRHSSFKLTHWVDASNNRYYNQQYVANLAAAGGNIVLTGVWYPVVDNGCDCEANEIVNSANISGKVVVQKALNLTDGRVPAAASDLSGIKFGLYTDSGCTSLKQTQTTDKNGTAIFTGLSNGTTYYVRELPAASAPIPARLQSIMTANATKVAVVAGNASSYSIKNDLTQVSLTITKSPDDDTIASVSPELLEKNSPSGAVFAVYDSESDARNNVNPVEFYVDGKPTRSVKLTSKVVENGVTSYRATITGLERKSYWIREIGMPNNGYDNWAYSDSDIQQVTVNATATTQTASVTQKNTLKRGSVTISKRVNHTTVDQMSDIHRVQVANMCNGVVYGIYADRVDALNHADNPEATITLVNGSGTATNLPYGRYYISEKSVPDTAHAQGLIRSDEVIECVISDDETDKRYSLEDELATAMFSISKIDEDTHEPISGVVFDIYTEDGNEYVCATTPTSANGVAVPEKPLLAGTTYHVVERLSTMPDAYTGGGAGEDSSWSGNISTALSEDAIQVPVITVTNKKNEQKGDILIRKQSNTGANATGAIFDVYSQDGLYATVTTVNGEAALADVPVGTYTIRESTPLPLHSFTQNGNGEPETYTGTVMPDETLVFGGDDGIMNYQGYLKICKTSTDTNMSELLSSTYSLAGATYQLYPIRNGSVSAEPIAVEFVTDDNGNTPSLAVPCGTYKVVETSEPGNYNSAPSLKEYEVTVTAEHDTPDKSEILNTKDTPCYELFDLQIAKRSTETLGYGGSAQGDTTLLDTRFAVRYTPEMCETIAEATAIDPMRTWILSTDEFGLATFDEEHLVGGSDEVFRDVDGEIVIPVGTFTVQEVVAPTGYHLGDAPTSAYRYSAETGGYEQLGETIVELASLDGTPYVQADNEIHRMDFSFDKVNAHDPSNVMSGIPFMLFLLDEDGEPIEQHLLFTDENAHFSSAAGSNAVVNKNDEWTPGNPFGGTIVEEYEIYDSRIWFSGTSPDVAISADRGALLYGDYKLQELAREDTVYYDDLDPIYFSVCGDGMNSWIEVDGERSYDGDLTKVIGKLENHAIHITSTLATDKYSKTHTGTLNDSPCIIERVCYEDATPGSAYYISLELYDTDNGERLEKEFLDVDGIYRIAPAGNYVELIPDSPTGYIDIPVDFNGYDIDGRRFAVKAIVLHDGYEADRHNDDLLDADEAISFPHIETDARDMETGYESGNSDGTIDIVDTVHYTKLVAGEHYVAKGVVMNRETQLPMLDKYGNEIRSTTEFTPISPDGDVIVEFSFDAQPNSQMVCVAYEEIYSKTAEGETLLCWHKDMNDSHQTVTYSNVATVALDSVTGEHIGNAMAGDTITVNDTLTYNNLVAGREYRLIVYAQSLDDNGQAEHLAGSDKDLVFTPTSSNGEYFVATTLSSHDVLGKRVVICEEIWSDGKLVSAHDDLANTSQTVAYPDVSTLANDIETTWKLGHLRDRIQIRDVVNTHGMIRGAKYTVEGTIIDADTGEELKNQDGSSYKLIKQFSVSSAWDPRYLVFDNVPIGNARTVVVYERIYSENGNLVAEHCERFDENQTVHYPYVTTTALDVSTESHVGAGGESRNIVDTVEYRNLFPGYSYEVVGQLRDAETGDVIRDADGREVSGFATFTPSDTDGSIEIAFDMGGIQADVSAIVAFERIYLSDMRVNEGAKTLVAEHEDLGDEQQTVVYPSITTSATDTRYDAKVGDSGSAFHVVDAVSCQNLIPGVQYALHGTLMDRESGEPLIVGDDTVECALDFVASESNQVITMDFGEIDSALVDGRTIVVFETLLVSGYPVHVHADISDEQQTVYYPHIITQARDKVTGTHEGLVEDSVSIVDTVFWDNLKPGEEYEISGRVVVKSENENGDGSGHEIDEIASSAMSFTADNSEGSVELEFSMSRENVDGRSVVVFEELYDKRGNLLAVHDDIDDFDQTVAYPKVLTQAIDGYTKTHAGSLGTDMIIDTLSYDGLTAGKEYFAVSRVIDANTGEPVLDDNGEEVVSKCAFTASESGTSDIAVKVSNVADRSGDTWVIYEEIYDAMENGNLVAKHADIDDESQMVWFPRIRTVATAEDGGKIVPSEDNVKLIDTVIYENLVPGCEYTLHGTLMNQYRNEPLEWNGMRIIAESTFVPDSDSGETEVVFSFDGSVVEHCSGVVFEEMQCNGAKIAEHVDINDLNQTVTVTGLASDLINVPFPHQVSATGDGRYLLAILAFLMSQACAICAAHVVMRDRRI